MVTDGWKQPSEYGASGSPTSEGIGSSVETHGNEYHNNDLECANYGTIDTQGDAQDSEMQSNPWVARIFIIVWLCLTPVAIIYRNEITAFVRTIAVRGADLGKLAYLYYILMFIATVPLCMSVDVMLISAGFIFSHMHGQYTGIAMASLLSFIAYFITMLLCFFVSRYVLKSSVKRYLRHYKHYGAVIRATEKEGLSMVVMIRLSPFFPPAIVSYIFGTTNVKTSEYCIASFAALPSVVFFSYVGSLIEGLSNDEAPPRTNTEVILCFIGAVAVTIFAVYYTYLVTKKHLEPNNPPQLMKEPESPTA